MRQKRLRWPMRFSLLTAGVMTAAGIGGHLLYNALLPTLLIVQDLEGGTEQTGIATVVQILQHHHKEEYPYTQTVMRVRFHGQEYAVRSFDPRLLWHAGQIVQITYRDNGFIFIDHAAYIVKPFELL